MYWKFRNSLSIVTVVIISSSTFSSAKSVQSAERKSATGNEDQWVRLFNGRDLAGWQVRGGAWTVENGELVGRPDENGKGGWIVTEDQFGDFTLRLKYKTRPGGNSGVCIRDSLRGRKNPANSGYEIQILDDRSAANPTGSVYNVVRAYANIEIRIQKTIWNAGEWNQLEIRAVGDYITVDLNNTRITQTHDRRSFFGVIGMQQYGIADTVRFKDIEIQPYTSKTQPPGTIEERIERATGEWKPLFSGKNLDGWAVHWESDWKIEDGILVGRSSGGMGWLITNQEYENFILKLDFRISKGGNGGVCIRFPHALLRKKENGDPAFAGFEIQILDTEKQEDENPTGSIYALARSYAGLTRSEGWNQFVIYADGSWIIVYLNGKKVSECESNRSIRGSIGLQSHHAGVIAEYKNIMLKEIR